MKDKEIDWRIAPEIRGSKPLKFQNESISVQVIGARKDYLEIQGYEIDQGVFLPKEMILLESDMLFWVQVLALSSKHLQRHWLEKILSLEV
jgi:hypothetical protein